MTRLSAPFKVKKAFSETTVMSVDSSGDVQFDGDLSMDGSGNIVGPISSGPAASTGRVVLVQQTTIVSNTAKVLVATLPDGADLLEAKLFVKTSFGTAASAVIVRVGTSAVEDQFGVIDMDLNIAGGMHTVGAAPFTSAATNWTNLTGAGAVIYAAVTAVSGAVASAAEGVLSIIYVHKV